MTTREEALSIALELPGAYIDTPFHDDNWVVVRRGNKKIFLATYERQGTIWLNVKVRPDWSYVLVSTFESAVPAYHMNKRHWVSVILDGKMEDREIARLIEESYDLTGDKKKKKESGE